MGTLLAGRYQLERELGRGAMGVVYRALDRERGQVVAIKFLLRSAERNDELFRRFRREFRAIQRLSHPNIVAVYDYGVFEGQTFFTMECVEGRSFREALGRFSLEDAARFQAIREWLRQLCHALSCVHAHRIVHRDLKPSNILVTGQGMLKIMDFGVAHPLDEEDSLLTQQGMVLGTIAYMSPEQALGARLDPRADLYSVGVILYEALAGRRPFLDASITSLLLKQVNERPLAVESFNPKAPAELCAIAMKLLEKDPFARYQGADELLEALDSSALQLSQSSQLIAPRVIGRDRELRLLRDRLQTLGQGQGALVFVGGEPGIGKSRLLEEARSLGRIHPIQFFRGACFEGGVAPYGAFLGPLEKIAESLARRSEEEQKSWIGLEARALLQVTPKFAEVDAIRALPEQESLSPAQERYRVFSAITELLRGTARRRPLALLLEDLHWADALSVDLLWHLARNLVFPEQDLDAPELAAPILFLCTYRDDEIGGGHPLKSLLDQLKRRRQVERLTLGRLGVEQVAMVLQSMLALDDPPHRLAQRIYEESEGNPFFIEEIMKSLVEEGVLQREGLDWALSESYARLKIPESIQEIVNKRLERLDEKEHKILECAAVLGREFSFDLLLEATELDEEELLDAIDDFVRNGVITEREGAQEHFDFYHAKIREVVYGRLRPRERLRYHRKVAQAAERLWASELERHEEFLAHHCLQAGLPDKAVEYLYRAGRRLQERYLNEEAIRHFRQALVIFAEKEGSWSSGQALTRLACFNALGQVLVHKGESSEAVEVFQRMEAVAAAGGQKVWVAWASLGQAQACMIFGQFPRAHELCRKAEQIFSLLGELSGLAFCYKTTAAIETFQHNFASSSEHYQKALELFEEQRLKHEVATILSNLGVNYHQQRLLKEATEAYRRSLELHRATGDKAGIGRNLINLGVSAMEQGDYRPALELFQEATRIQQEIGNKSHLALCFQNQGVVFLGLGCYDQGLAASGRALTLYEELGQRYYLCQALYNQGCLLLALNDLAPARSSLSKALELAAEIDVPSLAAPALLRLAKLALREGRGAEALEHVRSALEAGKRGGDEEALAKVRLEMLALGQEEEPLSDLLERLEAARRTGSREFVVELSLQTALHCFQIEEFETAERLAIQARDMAKSSGFLEADLGASGLLSSLAERLARPLEAANWLVEALFSLESILDKVPAAKRESFLRRPDLHEMLVRARRLAASSGSNRLGSMLEVLGLAAELSLESAEEEETGFVDYDKLGIPNRGH